MKTKNQSRTISLTVLIKISRPFWWVNTVVPYLIGYISVTRGFSIPLLLGTIYFLFPYSLALYGIGDIFDGTIPKKQRLTLWFWIALTNLPFITYFFLTGSCGANMWLLSMILMVLVYSIKWPRFKEIPGLDTVTAAFHYTAPFIYGIVYAGGAELWIPAYLAFSFWAMSNYAFGAIQDISANRKARTDSIATALGFRRTVRLCLTGYVIAAIIPVVFYGWKGLVAALLVLPYLHLVSLTLQAKTAQAPIFRKSAALFPYFNYFTAFVLGAYLAYLAF